MNTEGTNIPIVSESSPLLSGNVAEAGVGTKDVTVGFASGDSASITEHSDKESVSKTFLSQTEEPPIPSAQRPYHRQESTPKVSFILGQFNCSFPANFLAVFQMYSISWFKQ